MEVAILQALYGTQWIVIGVFADKGLAEAESSLRGYVKWVVAEFGIQGVRNA